MRSCSILLATMAACMVTAPAMAKGPTGLIPALPAPDAERIKVAAANTWRYMYTHERSAHTNGAHDCGRIFLLAVSSWTGAATGDACLLQQTRHNLTGDACLVAAGGYGSQHERVFTGSCVLIRHTPRLWGKLTDDEKHKIDLLMKAALVASAYTTSDLGASDGKQNTELNGGTDLHRDWNPNYREGMIGMMIAGTIWHGGAEQTYAFLDQYDHDAFCRQLLDAGLTNTHKTFTWAASHRDSHAPDGEQLRRDIRNYAYNGRRLDQLMEIYWLLTMRTYSATVNTGLNEGKGVDGGGKLASGQADLPNIGKPGMLYEFDSGDAGGPRSSIIYAYTGFRPNLINQIVMLATGYWERGEMADACVAKIKVGVPDLYYKLEHGYINYANGHASTAPVTLELEDWDFLHTKSLWRDVALPFHEGRATCANAGAKVSVTDSDRNGTEAIRLNGTASTAAAGATIQSYRWLSVDGKWVAEGAETSATLPVGSHRITLEVTDTNGRVSRDATVVRVSPARP